MFLKGERKKQKIQLICVQTSFLVLITDLLPDEITCVKPYSLPSPQGTLSGWVPFLLRMSHPALVKLSRSIISYSHNGSPSLAFPLLFLSCTWLSGHWFTKRPATKGSHSSLSPTHTMLQGLPPLNMAQNTTVTCSKSWLVSIYRMQLRQKLPLQAHFLFLFNHTDLFSVLQKDFTLSCL